LPTLAFGSVDHVQINAQAVAQNLGVMSRNPSDAAHVGRKVVNLVNAAHCFCASSGMRRSQA
jgi:hypothetical protein